MYPIKVVEMKTGLTAHVIRAWEKRYGAVRPERSDTNRRFYTDADIARLMLLKRLIEQGYSIGQIATLGTSELERMAADGTAAKNAVSGLPDDGTPDPDDPDPGSIVERALEAVERMSARDLRVTLTDASLVLSPFRLIETVIVPMLVDIGKTWAEGRIRIANEHLATVVVRDFLAGMQRPISSKSLPPVIYATPAGHEHELGAMIASIVAEMNGYPAVFLGSNLPAEDIAAAVRRLKAKAVGLSLIYPPTDPSTVEELKRLAGLLPEGTAIMVGGSSAASYQVVLDGIGAMIVRDIRQFRKAIETIYARQSNHVSPVEG